MKTEFDMMMIKDSAADWAAEQEWMIERLRHYIREMEK